MVPLMALHKRRNTIAAAWWFCFLGGPVWVALLIMIIQRHKHDHPTP